jgi:hypothetical protein
VIAVTCHSLKVDTRMMIEAGLQVQVRENTRQSRVIRECELPVQSRRKRVLMSYNCITCQTRPFQPTRFGDIWLSPSFSPLSTPLLLFFNPTTFRPMITTLDLAESSSDPVSRRTLANLSLSVAKSKRIVVVTGAGISCSCGIPVR